MKLIKCIECDTTVELTEQYISGNTDTHSEVKIECPVCHKVFYKRTSEVASSTSAATYIDLALRTESQDFDIIAQRMSMPVYIRLQHAAMGLTTEVGEFTDALKKWLFYGKELDTTNLKEEIGDILWYLAIACETLSTTFEKEMTRNINKLSARYPEKFTERHAIQRDLDAEREVLETEAHKCGECGIEICEEYYKDWGLCVSCFMSKVKDEQEKEEAYPCAVCGIEIYEQELCLRCHAEKKEEEGGAHNEAQEITN